MQEYRHHKSKAVSAHGPWNLWVLSRKSLGTFHQIIFQSPKTHLNFPPLPPLLLMHVLWLPAIYRLAHRSTWTLRQGKPVLCHQTGWRILTGRSSKLRPATSTTWAKSQEPRERYDNCPQVRDLALEMAESEMKRGSGRAGIQTLGCSDTNAASQSLECEAAAVLRVCPKWGEDIIVCACLGACTHTHTHTHTQNR